MFVTQQVGTVLKVLILGFEGLTVVSLFKLCDILASAFRESFLTDCKREMRSNILLK